MIKAKDGLGTWLEKTLLTWCAVFFVLIILGSFK